MCSHDLLAFIEFELRNLVYSNVFAFICELSFLFCSFQNSVFFLCAECLIMICLWVFLFWS
jgi:hypothetical protein